MTTLTAQQIACVYAWLAYSKTIADMTYDDCQGHPMWFEKIERSHGGPGSQKYPLHLQSVHPDFRLHSQLCESETLRQQYTVAG
ncbi:trimethylamine-N-oxide reductase (cytochrome c), partial [Candidatus Hakubella thermalkaliphila]